MDTKLKNSENPSQADVTNSDSTAANIATNAGSAAANANNVAYSGSVITDAASAADNNNSDTRETNISEPQKPWSTPEAQQSQDSAKTQQAQTLFGAQASQNPTGAQQAQSPFGTQQAAQPPFDTQPSGPEKKRSFFAKKKGPSESGSTPSSTSKPSTWIAALLIICSGITVAFFPGARDTWNWNSAGYVWDSLQDTLGLYYLAALAILALLTFLLPFFKRLRQTSSLVKHIPSELAVLALPVGLL
ncbi:MAG: hypothetical protein LUF30_02115, partial [Lachnospiraceae bacterium]|nr:hypothetical protein [Lachnospiraceae bacterium]